MHQECFVADLPLTTVPERTNLQESPPVINALTPLFRRTESI